MSTEPKPAVKLRSTQWPFMAVIGTSVTILPEVGAELVHLLDLQDLHGSTPLLVIDSTYDAC